MVVYQTESSNPNADNPNSTYPNPGDLYVLADVPTEAYIKFNLSGINNIVSAIFYIYQSEGNVYPDGGNYFQVGKTTNSWSASSLTFNNRPGYIMGPSLYTVPAGEGHWFGFDVTNYAQASENDYLSLRLAYQFKEAAWNWQMFSNYAKPPYLKISQNIKESIGWEANVPDHGIVEHNFYLLSLYGKDTDGTIGGFEVSNGVYQLITTPSMSRFDDLTTNDVSEMDCLTIIAENPDGSGIYDWKINKGII